MLAYTFSDWHFSSYRDYVGLCVNGFIEKDIILSFFKDEEDYREFVMSGVEDKYLNGMTLED